MSVSDKGNQEVAEALIAADGLLGAGLQPDAAAGSDSGKKALMEALHETPATDAKEPKGKKRKQKGNEEVTSKAEPKTLEES